MSTRAIALGIVAGFAVSSAAFAGVPVPTAYVWADAQTSIPSGPSDAQYSNATSGSVSASARSDDLIGLGTFSTASAITEYGVLRAAGFSNGGVSGILQNASAESGWADVLNVAGSGAGSISFTFALDGTLTQSLAGPFSPSSHAVLAGNVGPGSDFEDMAQVGPGSQTISSVVTLGPFAIDLGVDFDVRLRLVTYVNGVGEANFLSTAHFTGIALTDALGAPITAPVSSLSGFNYAVPAPGAGALMLIGVATATRRRRN